MTQPLLHDLDDDALVLLVIEQQDGPVGREAAARLFGRYQLRVYDWCYRHVLHHQRALDLAQDALIAAWRELERFDGKMPFGEWLFAIAHDRCMRGSRPASPPSETAEIAEAPEPKPGPDALCQEFLAGASAAPESDAAAASGRLAGLVRDLAREPRAGGAGAPRSGESLPAPKARRSSGPSLRPALTLVALLVVAGGVAVTWRITRETPAADGGVATRAFEVGPARKVPGGYELKWDAVEAAELYQVRVLRPDLTELRALAPTAETRIVVPADSIRGSFAPVGLLAFRVTALREGAPIALSQVGTLRR